MSTNNNRANPPTAMAPKWLPHQKESLSRLTQPPVTPVVSVVGPGSVFNTTVARALDQKLANSLLERRQPILDSTSGTEVHAFDATAKVFD
jgi:hypothetical protein